MAETRICFVGGGSYNWMPKLLGDLALTPDLEGSVVLQDINPTALDDIQRYGQKVFERHGSRFSIETTTDLERGLDGADFVVVTHHHRRAADNGPGPGHPREVRHLPIGR